jgi:DNA-binding response OmpR family regulator
VKVLVVEDALEIVETIALCLTIRWPDTVLVSTASTRRAVLLAETEMPDLVLLDLGLPDGDGLGVLVDIRRFSDVPVIIVTAKDEELSRVKGLEMGADDYIVKPFSHTELLARVKAVLRRWQRPELWQDEGLVSLPGFTVDLSGHRVVRNGVQIDLTSIEWKLFSYLIRNRGRVLQWSMIAQRIWGSEYVTHSAIKMCIRRLRLKLGDNPQHPSLIRSHRGEGYSLVLPEHGNSRATL